MKNFFCNILFMGVLCFGFSAYSQNQNAEWKTCLEREVRGFFEFFSVGCVEVQSSSIQRILYRHGRMHVRLLNSGWERNSFYCLPENWLDGQHCQVSNQ